MSRHPRFAIASVILLLAFASAYGWYRHRFPYGWSHCCDLVLFWDKVGLGHNGERLTSGGHIVVFVDGDRRHVSEAEWAGFLEEQRGLLAKLRRGR